MLERYIGSVQASGVAERGEDEKPDRHTRMLDFLTLGLRLRQGVSLDAFYARFNAPLLNVLGEWFFSSGLLHLERGRITIDAERQLITNEILVRIEEALETYVRRETSAPQMASR